MIEDYTNEPALLDHQQQNLKEIEELSLIVYSALSPLCYFLLRMAPDESLTMLTVALFLVDKNERLKAEVCSTLLVDHNLLLLCYFIIQCLKYIGLFLYYVTLDNSPDHSIQWTTPPSLDGDEDQLYSTLSMVMRKHQADHDTVTIHTHIHTVNKALPCN